MKSLKSLFIALIAVAAVTFTSKAQTVVSGNPDFKIKITRCEASGKTVVIDMIWENVSSKDVRVGVYPRDSYAYDDEGNKYVSRNIKFRLANGEMTDWTMSDLLPAEIPLKARLQFEGVPESATMFKRIDLLVDCPEWGLGFNKMVRLSNIPITHEGD